SPLRKRSAATLLLQPLRMQLRPGPNASDAANPPSLDGLKFLWKFDLNAEATAAGAVHPLAGLFGPLPNGGRSVWLWTANNHLRMLLYSVRLAGRMTTPRCLTVAPCN